MASCVVRQVSVHVLVFRPFYRNTEVLYGLEPRSTMLLGLGIRWSVKIGGSKDLYAAI